MSLESSATDQTDPIVEAFKAGKVFVYPTEGVIGIGCDPDNEAAVEQVCALKQRPLNKGLILIADNYSQLVRYVDDQAIPMDKRTDIFSSWPGANTWLLPKSKSAPAWVTGEHKSIAVRVTAHRGVKALCQRLNSAMVSTSANLAGQEACKTIDEARQVFGDDVIYIEGETDGNAGPSIIRDALTGKVIRG